MTIQEIVDYLDAIPHSTFSFTCNDNQIIISKLYNNIHFYKQK